MFVSGDWEPTRYLGHTIVIDSKDIAVIAPDGGLYYAKTMAGARCWIKKQRRRARRA